MLLMCSDGLHGVVEEERIEAILRDGEPDQPLEAEVPRADRGGARGGWSGQHYGGAVAGWVIDSSAIEVRSYYEGVPHKGAGFCVSLCGDRSNRRPPD